MADATMHNDDQPVKGQGKRKRATSPSGADVTTTPSAPATPKPTTGTRKKAAAPNLPPFIIVDDAAFLDATGQNDTALSEKIDASPMDDLDAAERFDLGDTLNRSSGRGESLVELLDEAFDTLSLDDSMESSNGTAKAGRTTPRASSARSNTKVISILADAAQIEIEEVEVDEIAVLEVSGEESEPDLDELEKVDEAVEVDKPEELERFIDRALTMEGVSVDDSVRIYLREIGRTALLKSTDESQLAVKMAEGRKAVAQMDQYKSRQVEIAALETTIQTLKSGSQEAGSGDEIETTTLIGQYEEQLRTLREEVTVPDEQSYVRELELAKRTGDAAKQQLVQANLRLVVSIARRYIGRGLSLLDLVQEGNIGLMKAADKFDHAKGFKFSTYATWWIRQAITRAISDQSRTIRLPVHVTEMVTKLRRAAHELQQQLLREPTEEELGKELGMPAERVRRILDMARHPASLDAPMEEGEDSFLGDFIEDETTGAPEEEASRQMLKEQVEDILSKLTDRERKILEMRYGLADDRPRTLEEVAREFNITRERIRQIETRILRKLRYARYGASKLKGYLDY